MKRTILSLCLLAIVSCGSKEDPIGLWEPMKLTSKEVVIKNRNGKKEQPYSVTISGSQTHFTLEVTNYSLWWVSSIQTKESPDSEEKYTYNITSGIGEQKTFAHDWYTFTVKGNKVDCLINENKTDRQRTICLDMTAGDIFATINIVQSPGK